jgi:hypothetical protein
MNLYPLVFQQQNRYKFWNWDELFYYTKLTPTEIKAIVDNKEYQLSDPLSALVFSHKNHDQRAIDNIFDNYSNPSNFELSYNEYGLSTNFITKAQSPMWQNFNSNTDWYWKQNWIYKNGQWLTVFPLIKEVYLSCSAALENSHDGSDIDLMIQVHPNCVWITKPYFAILSKVLKYYDLNFPLAAFYFLSNQINRLKELKHNCVTDKIKIDFGLVFESQSQLEKYYSNKERNIFIWSALEVNSKELPPLSKGVERSEVDFSLQNKIQFVEAASATPLSTAVKKSTPSINTTAQEILNPQDKVFRYAQDDGHILDKPFEISNSIQTKKPFNQLVFKIVQILLYPALIVIAPLGILNYCYEQKHRENYNKLVLWNIYSQYNLVY